MATQKAKKSKKSPQRFFLFFKPLKKQLGKQLPIFAGTKNEANGFALSNFTIDDLAEIEESQPLRP
ncbi:MAG: hypothetical protein ABH951_00310 [Patescibacteria group bacterium]